MNLRGDVGREQVISYIGTGSQLPQEQIAVFISSSQFDRSDPRTAFIVVSCDK